MAMAGTDRVVAGRYRLTDQLGRGGIGIVWRAYDERLRREVAVKEIDLPATVPPQEAVLVRERLMREARSGGALSHPNVVTVYDVIEQDGSAFLVMELVEAPTLEDIVKERGPRSPHEAAAIGLQVVDALVTAHAAGVIHRDVKPSNVMLDGDRARLGDFGAATARDDPRITASGLVIGSPAFMSPEQAAGREVDPRSDLWSLGATLYYLTEGRPPFDAETAVLTIGALLHEDPPPPVNAGPLGGLIADLLEKDPARRPASARVRSVLQDVAGGGTAAVPTVADIGSEATRPVTTARSAPVYDDEPYEPPRRRGWVAVAALALLLLLGGAALWAATTEDGVEDTPAAGTRNERQNRPRQDAAAPADAAEETPTEATSETTTAALSTFELVDGHTVGYPEGWTVSEGARGPSTVVFDDPASSAYLLVAWTETPGPSAYDKVEQELEPDFQSRHPSYERVVLEPATFTGTDNAVDWEYTYEGARATNFQFVYGDDYGFALNFQAPESLWSEMEPLKDAIEDSFTTP